jgi:hypothetical protein
MTQDQVFVPSTRSQLGLKPLDLAKDDPLGASVNTEVMNELWEALGDSPIGAALGAASYLVRKSSSLLSCTSVHTIPFPSLEDGLHT